MAKIKKSKHKNTPKHIRGITPNGNCVALPSFLGSSDLLDFEEALNINKNILYFVHLV